jgi:hypothetical protein
VGTNLSSVTQSLFAGSEEPTTELTTAVSVLNLLVVFKVVADEEARAMAMPLATTNFLFSATREEAEFMTILAPNDNVSLLVRDELVDLEVPDKVFVLAEFIGNVTQVLDRHFLGRTYEDDVGLASKESGGQAKVVGEGSGLGVVARRGEGGGSHILTIDRPRLPMEVGSWLWPVVARREVNPRERFDHFSGELHAAARVTFGST